MERIQVITIGNELLSGLVINTNAAYLCRELSVLGLRVDSYHTIPDDRIALKQRLKQALLESSLVICTGGLGPTLDDNTRQVAAEIFDSGFRFDDGIADSLRERYGDHLASLHNQATVPAKATVLPNQIGTAPALVFEAKSVTLILLPGVPLEMHSLFELSVKPYLEKHLPAIVKRATEYLVLTATTEDQADPVLRTITEAYPHIDVGIYAKPGALTIALSAPISHNTTTRDLEQAKELIVEQFADRLVLAPRGNIEEAIQELFIQRGLTLSTAESCTGGAIATRLTSVPGASQYFFGSIVSYSNTLKHRLLSVAQETLEQHGAVSEETAIEMARGGLIASGSDYCVAVTGIAGPTGGSDQKPVGTVWIAVANRAGFALTWRLAARGPRAKIIEYSVNTALCRLWQAVNYF